MSLALGLEKVPGGSNSRTFYQEHLVRTTGVSPCSQLSSNLLPSLSLGDELKCSTPRAQRTGSTMHWRDVCTGLAEMLSPADGLVGDLLIVSSLTALMAPFCFCMLYPLVADLPGQNRAAGAPGRLSSLLSLPTFKVRGGIQSSPFS